MSVSTSKRFPEQETILNFKLVQSQEAAVCAYTPSHHWSNCDNKVICPGPQSQSHASETHAAGQSSDQYGQRHSARSSEQAHQSF